MKSVIVTPNPGTTHKYRLIQHFAQLKKQRPKAYSAFLSDLCQATGKSRMTLWRWQQIKHGQKEDIPHTSLQIIAQLLNLYGIETTVSALTNYQVREPHAVLRRRQLPQYLEKMT